MDIHGRVSVEELAKKFGVSEVTIRRDLKAISKEYPSVKRTYGGAIKRTRSTHGAFWHGGFESSEATADSDTLIAKEKQADKKSKKETAGETRALPDLKIPGRTAFEGAAGEEESLSEQDKIIRDNNIRIAEFAVKLIEENELITLESSDISSIFAQRIPAGLKIKVFTNSPYITNLLSGTGSEAEIYCSGGFLNKECNAFLDLKAIEFFNDFFTDKSFITVDAMDSSFLITTDMKEKADIKKSIIKSSREKIALCNSACLNATLAFNAGNIRYIDALVTDQGINRGFLEELKNTHLRVYVV
jgi:DeoR/GlpR family transcriptional regulator of sugar metabolism